MGRGLEDYRNKMKIKKEEEEKNSSSNTTTKSSTGGLSKFRLERTINLDTLESDLNSLGTTIEGIYDGWQTEETMKNTRSSIESMYDRLTSYQEYRKINGITEDEEDVNKLVDSYKTTLDEWDDLSMEYGQHKSADSYNKALKNLEAAKEKKKKQETDDLTAVQKQISDWKSQYDAAKKEHDEWDVPVVGKLDEYNTEKTGVITYYNNPEAQRLAEKARDDTIKQKYGYSLNEFKKMIGEKEAYYNQTKYIQDGLELINDARNDGNYEEWAQEGAALSYEDFGKKRHAGRKARLKPSIDDYRAAAIALYEHQGNETPEGYGGYSKIDKYRTMTEEEFKDFSYWLKYDEENGTTRAEDYIDSIEEILNIREGQAISEKYKDKSALSKIAFGVESGLDQFGTGVENALNFTDDYIPTTSTQYASQGIREQLYNTGFDLPEWLGGQSFGQMAYDAVNTTTNMIPSIALGAAANLAVPGSGTYVTAGLMGLSASGNAYQQMLNEGYNKTQSRTYATLVGLSEASLSALLSGMIGGKATEKAIENIIKGIDKGFLRFAVRWGMSGASEIPEESLQGLLEPMLQNIALGYEKNKAEDIDWSQIAYEGLLGGISGLGLGGVTSAISTGVEQHTWNNAGKGVRENARIPETLDIAKLTPQESDAYETYTRYAKKGINADNITDVQLGRLYDEANTYAKGVLSNKKSTFAEKENASKILKELSTVNEKATVDKDVLKKIDDSISLEKGYRDNIGGLIESGLESNENTKSHKLALKLQQKISNGEEVTTQELDTLIKANADAMKTEIMNGMSDADAKLFTSIYDGKSDVNNFADSFNLVREYSKKGVAQDYILEHRGVLSTQQVNTIYAETRAEISKARKEKAEAQQKLIDDIVAKHNESPFIAGMVDDSIMNYGNTKVEGKVDWQYLTDSQQKAISLTTPLFARLGADAEYIADGEERGFNAAYEVKDDRILVDVYAGMDKINNPTGARNLILSSAFHEVIHWSKDKARDLYQALDEQIFSTFEKIGMSEEDVLARRRAILEARENEREANFKKNNPNGKYEKKVYSDEDVRDEVIARACEDGYKKSEVFAELTQNMTEEQRKTFVDKIREILAKLKDWIEKFFAEQVSVSIESQDLQKFKDEYLEQIRIMDEMLLKARDVNQALKHEGIKTSDIVGKDIAAHEIQLNERLVEKHIGMLEKSYSEESTLPLDTLLDRYNKVVEMWKELGGELNSKFLEDWNNKVGTDRTFSVFKAQAGYKYNVELSSMCKKGVALFEAIDTIVKEEAMKQLKTNNLGKAEKEILYDILKTKGFEIPCAICYVEQARQREGVIIDAFLNGKVEKTSTGKVTQFKLGWNETLKAIQDEMKAQGFDYSFPSVDRSIATDNYSPADLTMDEETQEHFFEALKKVANKEIRRYNKDEKKSRKLITKTDAQSIKEVFKGKLPLNLMMFRTLFNEPSSRFMIGEDLLYSSMTTQNLAASHNGLYSLFNAQGGVGGYKTKQGTIIYWADILKKTWKPSTLRDEGGVRNQSNSDFLMYTLLDHAQMYIDFTAKGYYLQAYTKVLAELKLFGLSKGKINASFIPKVVVYQNADGSIDVEKTKLNAGLDENGNPIYDDFEGINHEEAFMLIEDAEYSKSIGGVCIGYSDNHILKLLDDNRIQLIIGFHDKTNDTSKRYKGAVYAENYNGRNEATQLVDGELKTKHIGFNKFIKQAEGKFKSGKESIVYKGKTYKYNDIPHLATDLYLEFCESKGYNPAYSQGGVDFSKHPNYYKLLADFSLYDINGNYVPHQKVEYNMPDQVPYLKDGKKAYMPTKDYVKQELQGELAVRDAISEQLADKSENGIIPQFIERANALSKETKYSDRDSEGNTLSKEQQEFFKDSKVRDENGNLLVMYHGTPSDMFYVFDPSKQGSTTNTGVWGKGFYFSDEKASYYWNGVVNAKNSLVCYLNITNPFRVYSNEKVPDDFKEYVMSTDKYKNSNQRAKDWLGDNAKDWYYFLMHQDGKSVDVNAILKNLGYDGIIVGTDNAEIVIFDSNQAKLTTNTTPTTDPDIRYSDREIIPITETEYKDLENHFGTTGNFRVAGYLLTNGKILDFSGKHWGTTDSRTRQVDHRDVQEILNRGNNGINDMVDMIGSGNIRLMPEIGGINLAVYPNEKQRRVLSTYINYMLNTEGEVTIDYDSVGGDTVYSKTYGKTASSRQILNDIRNYFNGGRQSELMSFHTMYSDRDSINSLTIDDLLKLSDEQFEKLYDALDLEDWILEDDIDEVYGGEISIDDISEELNVESKKIEILVRREGLGKTHIEEAKTAVMTQERIDRAINENGARFHPDYASRYITRISPKDFIDLTVSQKNIGRDKFDTNVEGDSGSTMGDFDYTNALRNSEQSPYLSIDRSTGQVIGHNGRHRIRALEMAGIESVEIEIELHDEDGRIIKYNSETIPDMAISSQFDTAIETHLANVIPFNEAHREEIEKTYGEKSHANAGVKYADRESIKNTKRAGMEHYWRTGMSDKEVSRIERLAAREVNSTDNYIDNGNKWLYNKTGDTTYFALYSTAHEGKPTILYACKNDRAIKEHAWFVSFIEVLRSVDNGDYEQSTRVLNQVLEDFWNDNVTYNRYSGNALGRKQNVGNVGTTNSKSNFKPSEALFNCLRNITETQKREKVNYSDRDKVSVYDKMGETNRLAKENAKLKEDVERLKERLAIEKERLKLEGKVTHGEYFNRNQLDAVAGHIRNIANSTYDKKGLVTLLDGLYSYISHSPDLNWQDMFAQAYDIARMVLDEAKPVKKDYDYYQFVLKQISGATIYVNEGQIKEAEYKHGKHWRNKLNKRFTITTNPNDTSLNTTWQSWSDAEQGYPRLFDAGISEAGQLVELIDIVDTLREGSEIVEEYNVEEQTRRIAYEIYNKFWTVQPIRTTADKYDKQIKRLNFEHRNAMAKLREQRDAKLKAQHKIDKQKAMELYKNLRDRKDKEIAEVKELGKKRLDAYKENAERKTKIQNITANALTLNRWLTKNSKEEHIHEAMKGPVINLLQAIDFSSKQLLGMKGTVTEKRGTPTRNDISLAKALSQVKDMMKDASVGKEELIMLYGHGLDDDIKSLVESVDTMMRTVGDNEFIINKMSLEELDTLEKIVNTIKHSVTKMNKFHTVNHAKGIANLSQEEIVYADKLGKEKVFDPKTLRGKVKKLLRWDNSVPYYAFKRFGEAGKKIFEAFQDGWDKLAFHAKEIIDYAKKTYTNKEVADWSKEIKTFDIREPATDMDLANPNYKPKYKKVQMTVAQIMSLYCSMKREQAKNHILQGGIRVADITMKKGQVIHDADGITLTVSDINHIISTLTARQKQVANELQKFMNTVCADWGNEVSMTRFGYKAFGEENYFPIESDANNLSGDDAPQENRNSLFKLLNMSFTKNTIEGANNRIVIKNIFDVFAAHSSDMAKYNALALPVLDMNRWYNYTEKIKTEDERFITKSVKASIENAFGKEGKNYIRTFLEDINGQQNVGRDTLGKGFVANAKVASVAANLRVALLQPTAFLKANAIMKNKYLTKALLHKPKIKHAEKYCGIALWKSLGYYDIDISKGLTEKIKHDETWKDKAVEWSMKGAEIGDKVTFGYLWNACELEIRDTRKDLKVGSKEFFDAVGKRLREVIYATQVVDSTMTRSQLMRSGNLYEKMITSFASEPTLAYNMLQDVKIQGELEKRTNGKVSKETVKKFAKVFMAYTITNMVAALIESGFDALRDDDDEEMDMAKFMKYYLSNFANDMSINTKIPHVKEFVSIVQGFTSSRPDTQWMQSFGYAIKGIWKMAKEGKGDPNAIFKNCLRTLSYATGLPFYNVYRDTMATLNKLDVFTTEDIEELFEDFFG